MKYIEMTVEEAMKICNKNTKVLVAEQDLTKEDCNIVFKPKVKGEYESIFNDVETVAQICDDFINQLRLFTEKQNIMNIKPRGVQKIVLLRDLE